MKRTGALAPELTQFASSPKRSCTTEAGDPLVLEPWQRSMLAGLRRRPPAADSRPKKQAKSSLLAGRGLYELIARPFAEVAVVAASRDQAAIILKQARGYIARLPALRRRLSVVQREIRNKSNGGAMKVLAADSDTLDGWLGTLALVDELGRWPSGENYGCLEPASFPATARSSASRPPPTMRRTHSGRLREQAMALPDFRRDPDNPSTRSPRPRASLCTSGLDPGDDYKDISLISR